jgi:hypothetical protein
MPVPTLQPKHAYGIALFLLLIASILHVVRLRLGLVGRITVVVSRWRTFKDIGAHLLIASAIRRSHIPFALSCHVR